MHRLICLLIPLLLSTACGHEGRGSRVEAHQSTTAANSTPSSTAANSKRITAYECGAVSVLEFSGGRSPSPEPLVAEYAKEGERYAVSRRGNMGYVWAADGRPRLRIGLSGYKGYGWTVGWVETCRR